MGALASLLFGWVRSLFVFFGLRFAAKKLMITSAIVVLLPVVLWNLIYKFIEWQLNYVESISGSTSSAIVELSGLAGWLAFHLNIPQVISVLLSALVTIFTLRVLRI